jgi:hypothetical protein
VSRIKSHHKPPCWKCNTKLNAKHRCKAEMHTGLAYVRLVICRDSHALFTLKSLSDNHVRYPPNEKLPNEPCRDYKAMICAQTHYLMLMLRALEKLQDHARFAAWRAPSSYLCAFNKLSQCVLQHNCFWLTGENQLHACRQPKPTCL